MTISLDDLPENAAWAARSLREALVRLIGSDLVALWLYGGTTFPDRPRRRGDIDIGAVIGHASPSERHPRDWLGDPRSRPCRIIAIQETVAAEYKVDFDMVCFLEGEVGGDKPPGLAFWQERRRTGWAIERAHWLAGQYLPLHGSPPEDLVVPPSWSQLLVALDRELEHLERHVYEGDAENPAEATYALFNGCRILHTLETGSPVLSKRSAGAWGLTHLPATWHWAIRAADRAYDGTASDEDEELLRVTMAPFVAMVREKLPRIDDGHAGPPRWS